MIQVAMAARSGTAGFLETMRWVDIEITRLQSDADGIIDIAMLVTDVQLAMVAEGRAPADERAGCRSWRRIPTTTR